MWIMAEKKIHLRRCAEMYLRDTIAVDMRLLGYGDMLRAYRLYIVYHTCGALSREFFRDLVPPFLSTCSRLIERGRYEDAVASSTEPRVLVVLAVQATYDLQSAYILCFL